MSTSRLSLFFFIPILIHLVNNPTIIAQRDPYVLNKCYSSNLPVTVPTEPTSTPSSPLSLPTPKSIMASTISPPEKTPTKFTPPDFVELILHQLIAVVVSICQLTSSYSCVQHRKTVSCGTWIVQFDARTTLYLVLWNRHLFDLLPVVLSRTWLSSTRC